MFTLCLDYMNKDLLIFLLLFTLILCIVRIIKLKKQLASEIYRRLHPQLHLELITYDENSDSEPGFYIKNESFFLLKDIQIQDIITSITDSGFKQELVIKFDPIDFLKSKEKTKLIYRAFDKQNSLPAHIAEKIVPHLLNISFSIQIRYNTIEGRTFLASFLKKRNKFFEENIEIIN
ncbi:hypothetical protein ACFL2J_00640 [Candidatus Omnitrophota bacterium]